MRFLICYKILHKIFFFAINFRPDWFQMYGKRQAVQHVMLPVSAPDLTVLTQPMKPTFLPLKILFLFLYIYIADPSGRAV